MEGSLLLLLCIISFLFGFFSVALYVSWQQASSLRKQWDTRVPQWPSVGCPKILSLSKIAHPRALEVKSDLTEVVEIDEELKKVLDLSMRDYFEKWYHQYISPDPVCVQHARDVITHIVIEFATKCKQVDYLTYFVETIMEDFMDHLKSYKTACSKVQSTEGEGQDRLASDSKIRMIENAFFEDESDNDPWKAVCCSPEARLVYFQRLTEVVLCLLSPLEDFSNPVLQVLLTDLGAWQIWEPLLRTITRPDNFNHTIITMAKENCLTPESLTAAITEGATELELRVLQFKIQSEIRKLQKTGITDLDRDKLNAFESIKETAKQMMDGEVKAYCNNNSSLLSFNVSVPEYIITHEGSNKHAEFVLDVQCRHSHAEVIEQWTTHRRYRDFQDLDLTLRSTLDDFPTFLTLPSLPSFNKLDPQRLETRRQSLDKYISTVAGDKFLKGHPKAFSHLTNFLTLAEFTRNSTELTRMVDTIFKPLSNIKRSAAINLKFPSKKPLSSSSSAAISSSHSPTSSLTSTSPHPSPNGARKMPEAKPNSSEEDEDSLPVDIVLVLLEELFVFSDKKWLRRQLPTILKQLAGGKISRYVVQTTDWLTSSEQVALYIRDLTSTMWPGGIPAQPHPAPSSEVKAIRSLLARAKLIGIIPDELRRLIGNESTVKGMTRLFGLFQSESLNCCLALRMLEGLLSTLFPSRNIKDTLRNVRIQISLNRTRP